MINLDNIINEEHNKKQLYNLILIIGGSGSGKTKTLLNLIKEQKDIDKIYLYTRDLSEPKAFIECSNAMNDVCENIDNYNPNRNRKLYLMT